MKLICKTVWAIFAKDIVTELRSKQVLPTMIVLGILIIWVMRIASEPIASSMPTIGPVALWIALIFSGLLMQDRCFAVEQSQDAISALLMAPVDPGTIYIAKLLVNVTMLCIFEIVIVPMVILAFQLDFAGMWLQFIAVLMLGNIAMSSIGTLFSAAVRLTRTRVALLSIVVLVILMPMMIPVIFALLRLSGNIPTDHAGIGTLAFVGTLEASIGYMIAFDTIFTVASWLLFGFVIRE